MNRRKFLVVTGAGAAALGCIGCAPGGGGGGGDDVLTQDFDVDLTQYPQLATEGKTAIIDVGIALPVAVTRVGGNDEYVVTSTRCTHRGCEVDRSSVGWTCPCHGSEYTLDGAVVRGPATQPLLVYDWTVDGNTLTILGMG